MSAAEWALWLGTAAVLIAAGVYRIRKYGRAEGGEVTPLNDLMDGQQVVDDTLAMVADMWDSFEEADVHGIEVDDTAAEADMVNANGPQVLAEERKFAEDVTAWMEHLDAEAWLGERGWL